MPADEHLGGQFDQVKNLIASAEGVLSGPHARAVLRAANIRSWPIHDQPEVYANETGSWEGPNFTRATETLHTRQAHLHGPTLRKYMAGDVPTHDVDYADDEGNMPGYHPTVVHHLGRKWIDEGHHRLIASRLNEEHGTATWDAYSGTPYR